VHLFRTIMRILLFCALQKLNITTQCVKTGLSDTSYFLVRGELEKNSVSTARLSYVMCMASCDLPVETVAVGRSTSEFRYL
jgi:hypothetical protein